MTEPTIDGHHDADDSPLARHGPGVWRLILRLLGDDGPDAADCFQQAFVEFERLLKRGGVRDGGAVLRRIAAVRAIDTVRRRSRDRRTFVPIGDANPPDARQRPPHEGAIVAELLDDLRAALAHLPEPQATAFVLTQLEDVAHGEAARTLGVTVNHVGVLLHRARAALRGRMNHHLNSDTREARR